jgi:hypothetical protein
MSCWDKGEDRELRELQGQLVLQEEARDMEAPLLDLSKLGARVAVPAAEPDSIELWCPLLPDHAACWG